MITVLVLESSKKRDNVLLTAESFESLHLSGEHLEIAGVEALDCKSIVGIIRLLW